MRYILEESKEVSTHTVEDKLGLNRGDVKELFLCPDGAVEIEISDTIAASLEDDRAAMEKAEAMIDAISNLAQAKVFLKKLCLRLFKNGALP